MTVPVNNQFSSPLTAENSSNLGKTSQGHNVKNLTEQVKKGGRGIKQQWQRYDKVEKGMIYMAILIILVALIALIALPICFGFLAVAPVMTGLVYPLVTLATVPIIVANMRRNDREKKIDPVTYRRRNRLLEDKLLAKRRLVATKNKKRRKNYLEQEQIKQHTQIQKEILKKENKALKN